LLAKISLRTTYFTTEREKKRYVEGEGYGRSHGLLPVLEQPKHLECDILISSFHSNNQRGIIDNIMSMKKESKFEFIHNSIAPGQSKEKVYIFKMLTKRSKSEVDLVRRMQFGGDLQNAWMMLDHIKCVKE